MEKEERLSSRKPGDRTVRVHARRPRRRLRMAPHVPAFIRFLREMASRTPLVKVMVALLVLWLLVSWGIYEAEKGVEPQIDSYGHALWWSFAAMQTQGANSPGPVTAVGITIGAIWSIVSTIGFFGVIIGTLYAYYMIPRYRPYRRIIGALEYNLEKMQELSAEELEVLRDTLARVIDSRMQELKREASNQ